MKYDIVLCGVGGQGILSIATIIDRLALEKGLEVKQAEVHGMAQRGGAVQSHLRIADHAIASDLIPAGSADLVLAVEPMEALRYLSWLAKDGVVVANRTPYVNIPDYPEIERVITAIEKLPRQVLVDAKALAKEAGNGLTENTVMLGAASPFLPLAAEELEETVAATFARKGEKIVEVNRKAFRLGREAASRVSV